MNFANQQTNPCINQLNVHGHFINILTFVEDNFKLLLFLFIL